MCFVVRNTIITGRLIQWTSYSRYSFKSLKKDQGVLVFCKSNFSVFWHFEKIPDKSQIYHIKIVSIIVQFLPKVFLVSPKKAINQELKYFWLYSRFIIVSILYYRLHHVVANVRCAFRVKRRPYPKNSSTEELCSQKLCNPKLCPRTSFQSSFSSHKRLTMGETDGSC